ncbi:MAG: porin family protein [Cyclobacteriaceae bacterium]|nr:porin family protein [Cyclobacteriaceae bacterium]
MKKLTDEELDSVFKAAAENNTPPYDPAAWEAMAKLLDAPEPVPFWKKFTSVLLIGSVVFIAGVWVGRTTNSKPQQPIPETEKVFGGIATVNGNDIEAVSVRQDGNLTGADETSGNRESIKISDQKSGPSIFADRSGYKPVSLHQTRSNASEETRKDIEELQVITLTGDPGKQSAVLNADTTGFLEDLIKPGNPREDSLEISREPQDKTGRGHYGVFIRLLASPDLSSVRFGPAQLGSNFGVTGEFAFSERFSVSTGVILARKNYESYQEAAYGSSARHLVGSCNILDVPLNLTYYFPLGKRFSAYVTAGASSYLMLREDYVYTVSSSAGDRVYPYQAIRKNNEWFKVLNLAAGMQYQVAPRWQVLVEPFVKAPLADLGERNVRLSSMGAFAGARYQLNPKIKNH